MRCHGSASLHDLFGDLVAFRNLEIADERFSRYAEIARALNLSPLAPPRKCDPTYGWVVARLLREARALAPSRPPIERVLFIGDTAFNDGAAFASIADAGGWPGVAFIGCETQEAEKLSETRYGDRLIFHANRWGFLPTMDRHCAERGFPIDGRTAVVFDIDKTTLGARGRNDKAIDAARVAAALRTACELLGDCFDKRTFETAYAEFGREPYIGFTRDNQDVLVYLCLVAAAGTFRIPALAAEILSGHADFLTFLTSIDPSGLPSRLRDEHALVRSCVQHGDATPFKSFRRNEYRETVARMKGAADPLVAPILESEIVITEEVLRVARMWSERGAVLIGLSDKPDEACYPPANSDEGPSVPLHKTPARVFGP